MRGTQPRLFADPQPLVERTGPPILPAVARMRDEADAVLYACKAKNLRKRLGSYRSANPDRMPRRLLRLVNRVAARSTYAGQSSTRKWGLHPMDGVRQPTHNH